MPISTGQITISDLNDTIVSSTQPSNPIDGTLWLDTSTTPNVLKVYRTGTGWVKATPTTAGEVGAVPTTGVIAAINASGEQVKIQGSKIDITGAVTFSSLSSTLQNSFNADGTVKTSRLSGTVSDSQIAGVSAGKISGTLSDSQIASAGNWNGTKTTVDGWKFTGKTTIDGGKIEADTISVAALKAGTIDASKIAISNDKVTIDSTGVTVKDANFYIEDAQSGTKYILDTRTNLLYDHSFELVPAGSVSGTYPELYYTNLSTVDGFNSWARTGSPLLRTIYKTDLDGDHIMFGYQQVVVNASNYVWQDIDVEANQTYTVSLHAMYPMLNGMTGGVPKIVVEFYGDDTLISSVSKFFTVPEQDWNVKERHAFTFTAPHDLEYYLYQRMRIKFMSTDGNWVEIDGVQCVKGSDAVSYNAEVSLWRTLLGQEKAKDLQTVTLSADDWISAKDVYLQTLKGTYNGNTIINDHLNGNISVSAVGGDLYVGYYNTNYIRSQKEHWMMAGGRVKAGSWIVENGNVDATNGIVLGGAFKFTSINTTPVSGDGVLWYGNGYGGKGLYLYKGTGWVQVK